MALEPLTDGLCESNGGRTTDSEVPRPTSRHQPELGPNPNNFSRLCSRDEAERAEALEELTQNVMSRLGLDRPGSARLDKHTLLQLLRVSRSCPLQEVRERAAELLRTAQERGVEIPQALASGPSAFIPAQVILEEGPDEEVLIEAFLSLGRFDHITMVMALHPTYLSCFLRTQHALLELDGPLPRPWRHYIVVMAAARHQCSYLVQQHSAGFLEAGGEESWLEGLQHTHPKIRCLHTLNKLLAHRPWLITQQHIQELVCPGADARWSLAELIHAVVLMTHSHSLSSFVWGCGLHPEPDHVGGHAFCPPSPSNNMPQSSHSPAPEDGKPEDGVTEVEVLMKRMVELQQQEEECSQEEMITRFERERSESIPTAVVRGAPSDLVLRLVEDAEFIYEDFSIRGEQSPPTMRAQDYSWEDHGFSLVNRLLPDMGQLLEEKFQVVCGLTYNRMAMHKDVDTYTLRKALWNYIHCLYGIRYDDYDYGEVNVLLERGLKMFVKTVACHPEQTTERVYSAYWRLFRHSEKVHVNLLLMEARLQAALLYTLRAVTRYMTTGCHTLHDMTTGCHTLHDMTTDCHTLHDMTTGCHTLHDMTTGCHTLHDMTTGCHTLHDMTTGCSTIHTTGCHTLHDMTTGCSTIHTTGCHTLHDMTTGCSTIHTTGCHTLHDMTTGCHTLHDMTTGCSTIHTTGCHTLHDMTTGCSTIHTTGCHTLHDMTTGCSTIHTTGCHALHDMATGCHTLHDMTMGFHTLHDMTTGCHT
ncbi:sestrin-2 isoform X18 [Salmo trutta]|uniref:sestrin-2 isoform X18 n=1 Tax=Salmo trutta TaxID=8032 RepID=UPI0011314A83|nr:sestrin-2-like isoform X18 [Salmo trutta]